MKRSPEAEQKSKQSAMYTALHFIDGQEVPSLSGRTFESSNPATGDQVGTVAFGEREDVERAIDASWRAYDAGAWRNAPPSARAAGLRRIAALIRDRAEEIARVESLDAGKPIVDTRNDVEGAATLLEYAATLPENVRGHVYAREAGYFSYSRREPYGVVGAIAPWNFPFLLAVSKTALPLAVGNSVILKMAEQTPLSTSLYARICAEAGLPPGVLNIVHGDGPTTGAALAEHPRVPKVTFTGSTEVGRQIIQASAASIKSCHLELGGKSPNIVLADANLEQAIAGSLFTSFFNSGQVCTSGSRLLVHEDVADEVVSALVERAGRLVVGDPLGETTRLGPLVSAAQLERVNGYVAAGVEAGASVVVGGGAPSLAPPHDRGFFVEPTIFADVEPGMAIAQEEIFGPVLSVLRFRDDDEAIALANDVAYGLAATVWTNRLDRAFRFAERLEVGKIWTNCPHSGAWHIPYEGHKQSGLGEDNGLESIGTFTKLKVNNISFTGAPIVW
jgi:acyl-CoA reductase-like NAD-dependent aldehyde dehydrogenase